MIQKISQADFKKMPWKNGKGISTQLYIFPESATVEKNDFSFRLSSAPILTDGDFSVFPGKERLLTPIKGAGFVLNNEEYEKFEVAHFSGNQKTKVQLLKGPIEDFGIIYDPLKVKVQSRILHLKTPFQFSIEPNAEYFITLLSGHLEFQQSSLAELETLHFLNETECQLNVVKSAILFYLKIEHL